jgi:D-beta-D-heptose 7-phosphate kinase / D-beta-D-heptose 1-phosphate adenosyltransferase
MSWQRLLRAQERNELQSILRSEQLSGRKVVFTNGVFDLIHPGHIRYLRAAKELGDILVVAINTDNSVRRLKGEDRPILPEHERVKIIASLEMVDYVTLFDEDTPFEVISRLRPDVLVKGGDYRTDQIVGRDIVEANGGVVKNLQFIDGASSSNIIERILAKGR